MKLPNHQEGRRIQANHGKQVCLPYLKSQPEEGPPPKKKVWDPPNVFFCLFLFPFLKVTNKNGFPSKMRQTPATRQAHRHRHRHSTLQAVFPALQGGPHNATIGALACQLREAAGRGVVVSLFGGRKGQVRSKKGVPKYLLFLLRYLCIFVRARTVQSFPLPCLRKRGSFEASRVASKR